MERSDGTVGCISADSVGIANRIRLGWLAFNGPSFLPCVSAHVPTGPFSSLTVDVRYWRLFGQVLTPVETV